MENTLLLLEQQQEFMIQQNRFVLNSLNITVEGELVILKNQQILATIYDNLQYILFFQTISLVLIAISMASLGWYVEKLTKNYDDEQCEKEVANGSYKIMSV